MIIKFFLSGSCVFTEKSDAVPTIGSEVIFRFQTYKKGIEAGTLVTAIVLDEIPAIYDYTADACDVVVSLDIGEINVHKSE
ncbi:hypothetical protein [uncultured Sphingomonas sp.]|uniref:hypothetical protein n=1 Tax=uncultured Sphingomonas sp. TaxID=158754 RepID=UPI0025EC22BB|nr:hypothetical protein [uncultured Sphingomonas sp.]